MKRQKLFRCVTHVVFHSLVATVPSSNKNLYRVWAKLRIAVYLFIILTANVVAQAQDQQMPPKGLLLEAPAVELETVSDFISSQIIFEETFDNSGMSWSRSGSWEVGAWIHGANSSYSAIELATTNLSGNYLNDANAWLISPTITLPATSFSSRLTLSFSEWFQLESGYDYGYVKISTDDGRNWVTLSARDGSSNWRPYRIDLTSYANRQIKLAFQLNSDASITFRGWAINDVRISHKVAAPLTATMTSLNSQNFPFIYANVAVDTFGVGLPSLTQTNFKAYENNVLQQNFFQVTPPTIGGGVRLADIVFVLDVSTSMAGEIATVKSNMLTFVNSLATSGIDYRVGFVVYANTNYVYNGGNLYSNQSTIISTINNVTLDEHGVGIGNTKIPEDGFDALYAASLMNFRPGAQKILILITDAPCHYFNDGLDYPSQNEGNLTSFLLNTIVSQLKSRSISCFVAGPANNTDVGLNTTYSQFISLYPKYSGQFSGPGSLSSETNGKFYIVTSDFRDILNDIAITVGNTYILTYKSSNPTFDGTKRNVFVEVTYRTYSDTANGSYIPGAAPSIRRTSATIALSNQAQVAGSTLTIAAEITDTVVPFVQSTILFYRTTGTANYLSLNMSPIGSNIYRAIIPGSLVVTPGLDYYITATDGQATSSDPSVDPADAPYQIAILPNQPPQITHTPVTEANLRANVTISATVVDNTNRVSRADLYYREFGTLLFNTVMMTADGNDQYSGVIPGSIITKNGAEYYIRAIDDFGVAAIHGIHSIRVSIKYGTTVITHGYRYSSNNLENDAKWTLTMAKAIAEQLGGGQVYAINQGRIDGPLSEYSIGTIGEKIIVFNWLEESDKPVFGYTEAAGDALAAVLIEGAMENKWSLTQLHFIGHSRGTVVLSEAIERLALYTNAANGQLPSGLSIDNKIHFTTLDAHPWDDKIFDQIGDPSTAWDYSVNSANINQGVVCWENVAYADNYWQKKLFDLNGLRNIKGGGQTKDLSNLNSMSHAGVHVWYHGTIDRNASNDDAGDSIYVSDWYPDDWRVELGFNQTVAINAKMDGLKTTGTVPVIDDKTLVISQIFNGDFSKRDKSAFIPGWEGHGGGGTGVAEDTYVWFNPYLKLDEVNNYRGHNKFYVPVSAEKIWFRMQVMKKSADDLLVVLIDGRLAGSRNVNTKTSYVWYVIDAVPLRGKAHTLDFTLLNKNSNQDNATLFIDDVGFKRIEYISAIVASPVYLHAYDSRGYHTGPTSDSTWVAEIPDSEYYPEGDSPSKTRQTIILPKPPNGITYSFRIESKKATGNFSFQVEDVTNAAQTISTFFDSVAIQPNTIATYNMASGISGNTLAIDRNGDGIFDANVAPSRYFQNFTIIATAEPNGAITPADTNFVLFGEDATFSVTANAGYSIADILVDGRSVGPVSSYTFPSVKENHTMHARFSRTTAVHESPIIPTEYTLYQNHPNPFNPETNIEFALPKPEQVRLRIFDVYGREVRFLFTMWLQAGLHAVKWDGRDDDGVAVGSGVYFYRLQAGSFTETKKLVLMR
jgi:hypothetical protein